MQYKSATQEKFNSNYSAWYKKDHGNILKQHVCTGVMIYYEAFLRRTLVRSQLYSAKRNNIARIKMKYKHKKRVSIYADPLLTNPLNSGTKLQ